MGAPSVTQPHTQTEAHFLLPHTASQHTHKPGENPSRHLLSLYRSMSPLGMVVSSWNRTVMSAQHGQRDRMACLDICSSIGWLQNWGGYKRARPRTVLFDEGVRVATEHGAHRRPVHSDVEEDGARGHSQSSWWACHKVLLGHLQANGVGDVGVNLRQRARNSQSPRGWGHGRASPSQCYSCTSTSTSTMVRGLMEATRPHTCDLHRSVCCTHDGWSSDDSAVTRKRRATTGDTHCLASQCLCRIEDRGWTAHDDSDGHPPVTQFCQVKVSYTTWDARGAGARKQ